MPFIDAVARNEFGRALARTNTRPRETFRLTNVRLQDSDVFLDVQFTGLGDAPGISGTVVAARITTDQVQAEKQLRLSESKLQTIFHSSPDAILIMRSSDSTILDFNTSFTRLLGYTREEGIGLPEPALKIWGNELDRERITAELEAEHECLDFETDLVAKNGEVLPIEISVRYVEIDGEICILCTGRDITKRRLAEKALKESEEKFARIFAGSPDGIVIISLVDNRIIDINDAFVVASGFSYEELVGHRVNELPIFDDIAELKRSTAILAQEGSLQNFDLTFRTKSGEPIPALVSATIVELDGERSIVCIAKDNRAQRDAERKLRASEARFRGAFENAPIGMLLADNDGYVFQANNFALETLAYAESEIVGCHISRLVPPNERQSLKETLRSVVASLRQRIALGTPHAVQGQHRDLDQLPRRAATLRDRPTALLHRAAGRHHRDEAQRGAHATHGVPRHADGSGQPQAVHGSPRASDRTRAAHRRLRRAAVSGSG